MLALTVCSFAIDQRSAGLDLNHIHSSVYIRILFFYLNNENLYLGIKMTPFRTYLLINVKFIYD